MRTLLTITFFALFLLPVKKKLKSITNPIQPSDNSLPSGAVIKTKTLGKSNSTVFFDLDIVVFDNSTTINNSLSGNDFYIDDFNSGGLNFSFNETGFQQTTGTRNGSYSSCLLLDQSGSIANTDPNNDRITAAKTFCQNLGPGDNMVLSAFASGGSLPYELTVYGTGFTSDGNSYISVLEDLKNKVGGGTPLYKSVYSMINYTSTKGSNSNKAVVIFTDGDDTDGSLSAGDDVNYANSSGVKLYTLGLGSANIGELADMANSTGGSFMFAQDARQLISMFGNLGKLLEGTANYYHTSWQMQLSSNVTSGWFSSGVKVTLPGGITIWVPFKVTY